MSPSKTSAPLRGRDRDAGDTLVEILISVAILGIVGAALIGGFLTAITTSSDYRGVASSDTVLRTAVDTVTSQMQQNASAAFSCSGVLPGDPAVYVPSDLPPKYSSAMTTLRYWVNGVGQTSCSAQKPQLITLAVTYTNGAGKSSTNHATFAVNDPQAAPVNSGTGASQLVFLSRGGPSNSTAGAAIPNQPLVAVENSSGQIVTSDLSAMSISITPGSGTAGARLKTCTGSEFYGVVNFSGCEIDVAGTGYTLTATDGSLTATSSPFNVSPGPPNQLVFTQSPGPASQAGTDSSAFTDEPIVAVEDAYANIVTSDTS
ncbi:MAG: prepilin-type N-terminal cleavage/methylation domain-containing protein, partial [Acidimicrobiales bacterium]